MCLILMDADLAFFILHHEDMYIKINFPLKRRP